MRKAHKMFIVLQSSSRNHCLTLKCFLYASLPRIWVPDQVSKEKVRKTSSLVPPWILIVFDLICVKCPFFKIVKEQMH